MLDATQTEQWRECIEWNAKNHLYQKILPYQLAAGNERDPEGKLRERLRLPPGMTVDDYGFGLLRRDGRTPRPAYRWIETAQPNAAILRQPRRTLDLTFNPIHEPLPPGAQPVQWHAEAVLRKLSLDSLYPARIRR